MKKESKMRSWPLSYLSSHLFQMSIKKQTEESSKSLRYYDTQCIKTAHLHAASRAASPIWLSESVTNPHLTVKCAFTDHGNTQDTHNQYFCINSLWFIILGDCKILSSFIILQDQDPKSCLEFPLKYWLRPFCSLEHRDAQEVLPGNVTQQYKGSIPQGGIQQPVSSRLLRSASLSTEGKLLMPCR